MSMHEDRKRYNAAMHGVQTGVMYKMEYDPAETSPKQLRVGINAAMSEHAALTNLLIDKGILTWEEYYKMLADYAEKERDTYQKELTERFGLNIVLG